MKYATVIPALVLLAGCSAAELAESATNAKEAALDTVGQVLKDPASSFTPTGLVLLASTFFAGLFARQGVSVSKWVASGTGGWLVRQLAKLKK